MQPTKYLRTNNLITILQKKTAKILAEKDFYLFSFDLILAAFPVRFLT